MGETQWAIARDENWHLPATQHAPGSENARQLQSP